MKMNNAITTNVPGKLVICDLRLKTMDQHKWHKFETSAIN